MWAAIQDDRFGYKISWMHEIVWNGWNGWNGWNLSRKCFDDYLLNNW
jgi:hypothetical protein